MAKDKTPTPAELTEQATAPATTVEEPVKEEPAKEEPKQEVLTVQQLRDKYKLPKEWSDSAVTAWGEYAPKEGAVVTQRGNYVYDPTRDMSNPNSWPYTAIQDWMDGLFPDSDVTSPILVKVTRRFASRSRLNEEWTPEQVLAYHREGVKPPTTANGNLLKSAVRDRKNATKWSDSELEDWVKGELSSNAVASDQQLAEVTRERFKLIFEAKTPEQVKDAYLNKKYRKDDDAPAGLTATQVNTIRTELELYISRTAPNVAITGSSGARAQKGLQWVFEYILNIKDNRGFIAAMDIYLEYVAKYRHANFEETYALRFIGDIVNPNKQQWHFGMVHCAMVVTSSRPRTLLVTDISLNFVSLDARNANRLVDYFKQYATR